MLQGDVRAALRKRNHVWNTGVSFQGSQTSKTAFRQDFHIPRALGRSHTVYSNHLLPEGSLDGGDVGGAKGEEGGEGGCGHQSRTHLAVEQGDVLH